MFVFVYRCPNTGFCVQGFTPDEIAEDDPDVYEAVLCAICKRSHLVNPSTRQVVDEGKDE